MSDSQVIWVKDNQSVTLLLRVFHYKSVQRTNTFSGSNLLNILRALARFNLNHDLIALVGTMKVLHCGAIPARLHVSDRIAKATLTDRWKPCIGSNLSCIRSCANHWHRNCMHACMK